MLAAIRKFFDVAVIQHAIPLNPALSVRGPTHQVIEGKTPEVSIADARRLLDFIDTSHIVGLRDRAICATLIYTGARVGAVAKLTLQASIMLAASGVSGLTRMAARVARSLPA